MRDRRFLSTILIPASSYALIDLNTLKAYLGISGTQQDAALSLWVNAASAAAQRFTSNPFVVETRQDQYWPTKDGIPWTVRNRPDALLLQRKPVTNAPSPALTRPPIAPTLTYAAGGSLAARTYYVRLSYTTASGETAAGPESRLVIPAGNLLTVAAPGADFYAKATSWSVYAATSSSAETQQATGLSLTSSWTEPTSGLGSGAAMPAYALVVEAGAGPLYTSGATISGQPGAGAGVPTPLAESVDFLIDPDEGEVARLNPNGNPKGWRAAWISATYSAGYSTIPYDVVEAVAEMVKARYFAQSRDPNARSVNVVGVMEQTYFFGSGPGSDIDMPPNIQAKLERYRVPTVG